MSRGPANEGDAATGAAGRRASVQLGHLLAPALLVLLYAAARWSRLAGDCLWFDEIFGLHAASHDWRGLWPFVAADLIHPPLFYALLKLWITAGGESILWLELFSYTAALLCLVPFLLLARELRLGATATRLALLVFAVSGYLIKYAQEVRMYALLLLLTLTSLWLFAQLARRSTPSRLCLIALALVNLLLVYTHYYGWLVVCGEAVYLAASRQWNRLRAFLLTMLFAAVCFAPWVWACLSAAGAGGGLAENVGWIERPTFADAFGFYALLHEPFYFRQSSADPLVGSGGTLLGALIVGLPVLFLILRSQLLARRATNDDLAPLAAEAGVVRFLLFFALFPVVVSFLASHALPHAVWGPRHLIVSAGPYVLLVGLALARLRPRWLRGTALALLLCWYLVAGVLSLMRPTVNFVWCAWGQLAGETFKREAMAAGATDIFAFEDLVAYQLWHELGAERGRFRLRVVKGLAGITEDPSYFLPRSFDEVTKIDARALDGERFWVAFRDTSFDETRPPLNLLRERGYVVRRRHEMEAQGQRVFLLLVSREGAGAPL
jgi:uncharacterized membrane protein